jgi:protein XagA
MKNSMKLALFLFLLLCMVGIQSELGAQAWTKNKCKGFYKLDFTGNNAVNVFGDKRKLVASPQINNYTASLYAEHGLTDKVTVVAYVPFWVNNSLSSSDSISIPANESNGSFGDVDLSLRVALPVKTIAMSVQAQLGLPTGDSKNANGLLTGDGELNQMIKLWAGYGKTRWWIQSAVGFNNRTEDFSDEIRYDFEFGYKFLKGRFLTTMKINGIESLDNGDARVIETGLYSNKVGYLGLNPEFLYYVNQKKNLGIALRFGNTIPSRGRNVLAATSYALSVCSEF